MSKLETNQVDPATGTTLTLGTSGDTITIPSGVTIANSGTATGFAANTPYFFASLSSNQTVSDSVYAKVEFNDEEIDSDGTYDNSSNYRFTPTTAGKYYVFTHMVFYSSVNENINGVGVQIYKNGTRYINSDATHHTHQPTRYQSFSAGIIDFNGSSDYVEAYAYVDVTSSATIYVQGNSTQPITYFGAYKLI